MVRETDVALAAAAFVILAATKRKRRRFWVKPSLRARTVYSGRDLLNDLQEDDRDPLSGELRCDGSVKNFLRMTSSDFEWLIVTIGHQIGKRDTNYRKAITVQERLAVTLRYLATGDSYTSLGYLFKISKSTISLLIPQVLDALIDCFKENVKVSKLNTSINNIQNSIFPVFREKNTLLLHKKYQIIQNTIQEIHSRNLTIQYSVYELISWIIIWHVSSDCPCRNLPLLIAVIAASF